MHSPTLHYIPFVPLTVCLCLFAGCWEEIEYVEPGEVVHSPSSSGSQTPEKNAPTPPSGEKTTIPSPAASNQVLASRQTPQPHPQLSPERHDSSPTVELSPTEAAIQQVPSTNASTNGEEAADGPMIVKTTNTRRAAWLLGSKLSLATVAHDRGWATEKVAALMDEARQAADALGTTFMPLPTHPPMGENQTTMSNAHRYLLQQGQQIWQDLATTHGLDHAALFEMAVKSNVLLVLYEPGGSAANAISAAIAQSAPRSGIPEDLWRPLLAAIAKKAPPDELHDAVRRMHMEVDHLLVQNSSTLHD